MSPTLEPGVLKLATSDLDARPLFWNEGTSRYGYEPDAAEAVAAAMGLRLEWVYTDWAGRMKSVLDGESDGVWCGVTNIEERREFLGFSDPYGFFNEACLVRQGVSASTPDELVGSRIGAIEKSTNLELVLAWPGVIPVTFSSHSDDVFTDMIEATASGVIDGFVDDEPAMIPLAERDSRLVYAFSVESRHPWACGVRPENTGLIEALNAGLARALSNGDLEVAWQRHLPFLDFPFGKALL